MATKICTAKISIVNGTQVYSREDGQEVHGSAVISPDSGGVLCYWDGDPNPAVQMAPIP